MYNNETMKSSDQISATVVNINDGGMKVILYIDRSMINKIVNQLKNNDGQLDNVTAMAIASTVARVVKEMDTDNWNKLRAIHHKPSDPSFDIEEEDDPRTVFAYGYNEEE